MNMKFMSILLIVSVTRAVWAQESFAINEDEITLLGLEFSPVTTVDNRLGVQLPARIIAAPDVGGAVVSPFAGVISQWLHTAGDNVAAGDVLAIINSIELTSVQQDYLEHYSEQLQAQQQLQRDEQLWQQGIIAQARLQQTQAHLGAIQSQVRAGEKLLTVAGLMPSDLMALGSGEFELGQLLLRAPVSGIVARRLIGVGEYVETNSVVAHLTQSNTTWASIQVPSRLLTMVNAGVHLSSPQGDWNLTLVSRDHVIDPLTQSAQVLAQFSRSTTLLPGQLINIVVHPAPDALLIPAAAVVHEGSQTLVYVYVGQRLESRALELVPVGDGYIAQSGINAGEQLVVKGAALVKGMQLGLGL